MALASGVERARRACRKSSDRRSFFSLARSSASLIMHPRTDGDAHAWRTAGGSRSPARRPGAKAPRVAGIGERTSLPVSIRPQVPALTSTECSCPDAIPSSLRELIGNDLSAGYPDAQQRFGHAISSTPSLDRSYSRMGGDGDLLVFGAHASQIQSRAPARIALGRRKPAGQIVYRFGFIAAICRGHAARAVSTARAVHHFCAVPSEDAAI